jgi:hypothetical protein
VLLVLVAELDGLLVAVVEVMGFLLQIFLAVLVEVLVDLMLVEDLVDKEDLHQLLELMELLELVVVEVVVVEILMLQEIVEETVVPVS